MSYSTNTEHHHHRFETEEMNHLYKKKRKCRDLRMYHT